MKSLTLGFFYLAGISWALAESCILAANGDWTALIIFLAGFALMFAILGCLPLSNQTVDFWGSVFAILLALGLVYFAVHTALIGAFGLASIKGVFALGFAVIGVISFLPSSKTAH
jgi:hypothetical protein